MLNQKVISIVIPIYNEVETLPTLWERLHAIVDKWRFRTEIIFVNDGSTDNSLVMLKELYHKFPELVKIINLSRNFGHQPALTSGIHEAEGDAVILMDGDLQDTPESLPKLIEQWEAGFDVVYAIRVERKEFFLKRWAFSLFYKIQSKIVDLAIPLDSGIFSLMDRKVVNTLASMQERNRYLPGLRSYAGFKQTGIMIERAARFKGEPKVSLSKLVKLALDGIFSMSHLPLRMANYLGLMIAALSFILAAVVVWMKLFTEQATPGWASNLASTFFIGGVQLIFLGIIGEYLGRIYDEVKKRPYYIISEKIGFSGLESTEIEQPYEHR